MFGLFKTKTPKEKAAEKLKFIESKYEYMAKETNKLANKLDLTDDESLKVYNKAQDTIADDCNTLKELYKQLEEGNYEEIYDEYELLNSMKWWHSFRVYLSGIEFALKMQNITKENEKEAERDRKRDERMKKIQDKFG